MRNRQRPVDESLPRLAKRKIVHACVFGLSVSLLASAMTAFAAKPVDGNEYRLSIAHRVVAQTPLDSGKVAMELQLTLSNDGDHALYDLRLFLTQAGPVSAVPRCEPARLRRLDKGDREGVTFVYECLSLSLPDSALQRLQFRVEAVDVATREIVSFASSSQESH